MLKLKAFLAALPAILYLALKVGVAIGATGTFLEELGKWRSWPKLIAFGQKLEAIGTDIPKLVGKAQLALDRLQQYLAFLLIAAFLSASVSACSWLGKGGPVWPIVAKCEPSPVSLIDSVTAILLAGGDYETALEQLAEKYGATAIVCVVDGLVGEFNPADSKQAAARVRGKAFLAHAGTKVER